MKSGDKCHIFRYFYFSLKANRYICGHNDAAEIAVDGLSALSVYDGSRP